ncbi:MAG TPA: B-box zinc finger protein, partial [Actinomycetota bacterium]|nr:B-box zinc finger protein [Actinomycetota bacterium]
EIDLICVNHPRSTTRVRCSNCDSPICVQCMQESAVGMKCPDCARVEYRRASGGKRRYAAGAIGLVAAALLGAATVIMFGRLNFLVAIVLGIAVGAVVKRIGRGLPGLGGAAASATICGLALGLLALGAPPGLLMNPAFLIPGLIATASAGFTASR